MENSNWSITNNTINLDFKIIPTYGIKQINIYNIKGRKKYAKNN